MFASTSGSDEEADHLHQMLARAGLQNMTTLRDLQAGMLQALEEIKERNETIGELRSVIDDKERDIINLRRELDMLKSVLENPLSQTESVQTHTKRIAISAAPVDINNQAGSESYAKYPSYVEYQGCLKMLLAFAYTLN